MPRGGMSKAGRVIENRHAHSLAFDRTMIIHPSSPLSPSGLISNPIGVDDAPSFFAVHIHTGGYAHAESRILLVAQNAIVVLGSEGDIHINDTLTLLHLEDMSPLIG